MSDSPPNRPQKPKPPQNFQGPDLFQPKVLLIWLAIFSAVLLLWIYPAQDTEFAKEWTIPQVLDATEKGRVIAGTLENERDGGPDWYVIRGMARPLIQALPENADPKTAHDPVGFRAEGRLLDSDFRELQESGVFVEKKVALGAREFLSSAILIGSLFLVLYIVMRYMRAAGRTAMGFSKSKARLMNRESSKVKFADVAGCDEAKEEVQEIVEFLRDPKRFERIGGRIPKGVLMVGPPGTGKTLLAKAIAGEANVPFFSVSGSDFVEMFVGVGASRVRDMFEQAHKAAPSLIFIDEIDAVGRQRGAGLGGGNDEREQTLNAILVEMDGFDGHDGVIVIAATNRPDVLDSALLRPGRFDRQVTIDLPDLVGREEILKVHAKRITLAEGVNLSIVARNTPGFSGADLENLLNEGALIAARRGKDAVDNLDLDQARDKLAFGRERHRLMDDEDKRITAYHEAGHALVQVLIDDGQMPVHKVTILPRGMSLGSTMFMPTKDILNHSKNRLLNQICCAMGGRAAEELVIGDITSGASGDIKSATKLARHMVCDWGMTPLGAVALGENQDHIFLGREISRTQNYSEQTAQLIDAAIHDIVEDQHRRALKLLSDHSKALELVAHALLEFETIDGKHIQEILEFGEIRTPVLRDRPMPPLKPEEPVNAS